MTKQQVSVAFEDAHALLDDLQSSLIAALDNEVASGSLLTKTGCVVAELQWPYLPQLKKSGPLALRLYLEVKVPIERIAAEAGSARETSVEGRLVANCPLKTGLRPCECDLPRCPVCNYTAHDAAFEMDHAPCPGKIPGQMDQRGADKATEPEYFGFAEHGDDPARDGDGFA